jgi:hypothetical protein
VAFDPTSEHPRLLTTRWKILEPESGRFNCIAWAMGDRTKLWWPATRGFYWPPKVSTLAIRASFAAAFALHGWKPCDHGGFEPGIEKVALYEMNGFVRHAARQLPDGRWTPE